MKRSFYPWAVVALLWVVAALNYIDRQVIFALFPLLRSELHLSNMQLGLLGSAFLWVYGICSPLGGYLADRFNRRAVILLSIGVWSTVTLLVGLSRSYPQLLAAQALLGISEACYLPAALALIADYHGEATRARAVGLHQSGLYAGVVLGGWGGGWIGQNYGWHQVFYVLGAFGVLYSAILFFQLKEAPGRNQANQNSAEKLPFLPSLAELSAKRSFWLVVCANCLAAIAFWCVYGWMATFLFERFHVSLTTAGFSSTFYIQAGSFLGIFFGGWLADSWSRSSRNARYLTQAIGFLLAAPALFVVGVTGSWWTLLACLVVFGLGRGFFDCNLMPVLCQIVPARLRATAYGVLNATSCIAGGVMAAGAGFLKDRMGLGAALQLSALSILLGAFCLASLKIAGRRQERA
ncbi:MAG: MFS transporter [Edaphobacter sp.]|uniref:MFS transporter n=1 Tax=Edaphobacter sp. TaxID=1934404 RepID=UPI0023A5EA98|nr:MFS transporter [Edaphobacter sp.]MDE1178223.1 MFS transporter [Edaphobacter sp.]